jgi:hypothetical protein
VKLHDGSDNRQSEAETMAVSVACAVPSLSKAFKYVGQKLRRDSFAVVIDDKQALRTVRGHADRDTAALRGELDRVGHEVPNGLSQALAVPEDFDGFTRAEFDGDALCLSGHSQALDGCPDGFLEAHRLRQDGQAVHGNARNIEQIVDQSRKERSVALERLERARPQRVVPGPLLQQLDPTDHGRKRVTKFVREVREELVFQAVCFARVPEHAVLQRHGSHMRQLRDYRFVVGVERLATAFGGCSLFA